LLFLATLRFLTCRCSFARSETQETRLHYCIKGKKRQQMGPAVQGIKRRAFFPMLSSLRSHSSFAKPLLPAKHQAGHTSIRCLSHKCSAPSCKLPHPQNVLLARERTSSSNTCVGGGAASPGMQPVLCGGQPEERYIVKIGDVGLLVVGASSCVFVAHV